MDVLRTLRIASAVLAVLLVAAAGRAQSWEDRGYLNASGLYQVTTSSFGSLTHPIDFVEAATVDSQYKVKSVPGFDIGGGVRVWRNLAIGVNVSRVSKSGSGSISAQVPHPFFFNRPRAVSGDSSGLNHEETAVDLDAVIVLPVSDHWQLSIAGGPSWFSLRQDLVKDVTVTQSYPFDTAAFAGVVSQRTTGSKIGFNAGFDATYLFARHVGLGASVTFARASVPLTAPEGDRITVDAGGGRVGGGIRFRF